MGIVLIFVRLFDDLSLLSNGDRKSSNGVGLWIFLLLVIWDRLTTFLVYLRIKWIETFPSVYRNGSDLSISGDI